jgi:hypothetical protein
VHTCFPALPFALESPQRLGHRAATTNESAQASLPNNWFKAARFVRWDRHSRALNQTLYVNTMTSTLKEKLLRLTGARYKHLLVAMSTFKESEDALGTLLRVHLTTESILEELIRLAFEEKSDAILSLDLRYHQKLELVSKLEIEEDWSLIPDYIVGSLRKLNKLRNQLAHSLDASITNSQVIELFIGAEQLYGDMSTASININLKRYAFFILGSMLPKFEKIDDSDSEQDV